MKWIVAAVCAVALGCGGGDDDGPVELAPVDVPAGCNPLGVGVDCMLPYPSNAFLVDGVLTQTGPGLPQSSEGVGVSLRRLATDGFSTQAHMIALFPAGLDPDSLEGAVTVVSADGAHTPHILVELDPRATDPARQGLVIRPLERLHDATTYVVGLAGLRSDGGIAESPSAVFRTIRDTPGPVSWNLAVLHADYEATVFPALEAAGVSRASLQLAWSFTTQSREAATADMMAVRAGVLAAVEATPPVVTVVSVEEPADGAIGRKVVGEMTVPLYLDRWDAGAVLHRGEDGRPTANGTAQVPFTINVPRSLLDGSMPTPGRLFQYGHGFFGQREEVVWSYCREYADEYGIVFAAVEWWGMDQTDRGVVADYLINDVEETLSFVERVHQGIANQLAFTVALKTTIAELPEVAGLYDPDRIFFHGNSQGHILGGTLFALSPHLERAALGVGGAAFTHMMMRSTNFSDFLLLVNATTLDPLEQTKLIATSATDIDRFDPLTYAPYVLNEPLEGNPDKRILLQIGIGDAQVPNLTSQAHARALGLTLLEPAARPVAGLEPLSGPADASAYVEYDFNLSSPLPGDIARPPEEDNTVHEDVRRTDAARKQLSDFLQPNGEIRHHCEGPCDPQ